MSYVVLRLLFLVWFWGYFSFTLCSLVSFFSAKSFADVKQSLMNLIYHALYNLAWPFHIFSKAGRSELFKYF